MNVAIVGSGRLADSKLAATIIAQFLTEHRPNVYLLPGHTSFNALPKRISQALGLSVEELHPPRPFWVGTCPPSVRKGMARAAYAKVIAQDVELVLAFKIDNAEGATFSQLVKDAKESVVWTLRPCGEVLLSTKRDRRPGA